MQVKPSDKIWQRMLFYAAQMITEQITFGIEYDKINRVIVVLIADFSIVKNSAHHHNTFRLEDRNTGATYPNLMEINFLELPKIGRNDMTHLGQWLRFFRAKTREEVMEIEMDTTVPAIKKACGRLVYLSGDEQARAIAESREKFRMDQAVYMREAIEKVEQDKREAIEKAEQRAEQRAEQKAKLEKQELARKLLTKGTMSHEEISELSKLSLDEVTRLSKEQSSKP